MTLLNVHLFYGYPPTDLQHHIEVSYSIQITMNLLSTAVPNNVASPSLVYDGDDWVSIPLTSERTLRARCALRLRQEFNPGMAVIEREGGK